MKRRKTLGAELHTETLADPLLGSNPTPDSTASPFLLTNAFQSVVP